MTFRAALEREWLPQALVMGIDKDELGRLSPAGLEPYLKAQELRQKQKLEELNLQSWMTGLYITHALACAFSPGSQYPAAPFALFADETPPEERSRREAELFAAYASEYNAQIKQKEGHQCDR